MSPSPRRPPPSALHSLDRMAPRVAARGYKTRKRSFFFIIIFLFSANSSPVDISDVVSHEPRRAALATHRTGTIPSQKLFVDAISIRYRQIRRYRRSNRRRYVPQIDKLVSIRCRNDNFRCRFGKEIELLSTSTKYRQERYRIDVESTNHFWLGRSRKRCF